MDSLSINWKQAAKVAGIVIAAIVILATLPSLLSSPEPPPLGPDVGLTGIEPGPDPMDDASEQPAAPRQHRKAGLGAIADRRRARAGRRARHERASRHARQARRPARGKRPKRDRERRAAPPSTPASPPAPAPAPAPVAPAPPQDFAPAPAPLPPATGRPPEMTEFGP